MRISSFVSGTLAVCAAAMLVGCGGGNGGPLSPSPAGPSTALRMVTAERTRPSHRYDVLYSFKGGSSDGDFPFAGLINVKGRLYGTTYSGGANGDGTVFSITQSGKETVLYSFGAGSNDGIYPLASLINVKDTLYSTTYEGGSNDDGTVFAITRSGKETVPHTFGFTKDGSGPRAGLLNVKGALYGTTYRGGRNGGGTVFSITTSGKETVLHSFKGGSRDGEYPNAGLIDVGGTLYGTTYGGGAYDDGTVFSIATSGKATVLPSFGMTGDGEYL